MKHARSSFSNRLGFVLAAAGSEGVLDEGLLTFRVLQPGNLGIGIIGVGLLCDGLVSGGDGGL